MVECLPGPVLVPSFCVAETRLVDITTCVNAVAMFPHLFRSPRLPGTYNQPFSEQGSVLPGVPGNEDRKDQVFRAKHVGKPRECVTSSCLQNEQMTQIYCTHPPELCPELILVVQSCVFLHM